MVEQRTENPRVDGSIPSLATTFSENGDIPHFLAKGDAPQRGTSPFALVTVSSAVAAANEECPHFLKVVATDVIPALAIARAFGRARAHSSALAKDTGLTRPWPLPSYVVPDRI